jgi:DNA-binding MarR family transcriptional regulator
MQDLIGHDRSPAAFVVYLYLYCAAERSREGTVDISHARLAESTGLSKSAVQVAVKRLVNRKLMKMSLASKTAVPEYTVLKPWRRR